MESKYGFEAITSYCLSVCYTQNMLAFHYSHAVEHGVHDLKLYQRIPSFQLKLSVDSSSFL